MSKKSLLLTFSFLITYLIFAQAALAASSGGIGTPGSGGSEEPSQLCDFLDIVAKVIRIIAPAVGIGFFLMLIYAGYKYIFSFGNPAGAAGARQAILTALIGVVVLLLIYGIFKSLELVTGINLLNFQPDNTLCTF